MYEFYNHIQYVVPENSEICFSIAPEARDVSVKLLDGIADIYVKDKQIQLPLQQEFLIQIWESSSPRLKTKTGCNFLVRGNHYVSSALQHGHVENTLFAVSPIESSYSFSLEKSFQLQVFPTKPTEQRLFTISSSRGAPEISGFKLSPGTNYDMSPFFPVLVKSSDGKPYSICVEGLERKVKLSVQDENHHKCMNEVKDRIFAGCLIEKKLNRTKRTILVMGPKNAGKTSFCQLLVNGAFEKNMTPILVDLSIKRNVSFPGSLSLSEVEGRTEFTFDFKYSIKKILHFGCDDFYHDSEKFYYFVVKKMGTLLSSYLESREDYSLSIIDTDGFCGEYNVAIANFVEIFKVDLVVYIGDEHSYMILLHSVLTDVASEFVYKPRNAEQKNGYYESKYNQHRIQKYFFGLTTPSTRSPQIVPLRNIYLYRVRTITFDYNLEYVECNSRTKGFLLNRVFGVSEAKRNEPYQKIELDEMIEIKYYVYFADIDLKKATVTVMVPKFQRFNGGILLLGQWLRGQHKAIDTRSSIIAQS